MRRGTPSLAMALVVLACSQARAQDLVVEGAARVIDGDTLDVGSTVVRLADIDAPELGQRCAGPRTLERCGKVAADALSDRVDGEWVICAVQAIDDYGRSIANCSLAGIDLSTWLVAEGYALAFVAYSDRLQNVEAEARAKGAGLFATELTPPWEYRAARWQAVEQTAPEGCLIKGNISRSGDARIYHAPWSPHYERTRIDTGKGERWFCTEGEALAAGWRPPRR